MRRTNCRRPSGRPLLPLVGWATLAGAAAYYCMLQLFTGFRPFDDEGFILHTVNRFRGGYRLYDDVFTLYGPFYYLLWLVYPAHEDSIGHDDVRLLTASARLLWSLCSAWTVYRMTRDHLFAATGFVLVLRMLHVFANEPGHPQVVTVGLTVLSLLLSTFYESKPRPVLFGLGAIAAAALLTKVNVGLFFTASAAVILASSAKRPLVSTLCWGLATLLPAMLVGHAMAEPAWNRWLLVETFSIVAVGFAVLRLTRDHDGSECTSNRESGPWAFTSGFAVLSLNILMVTLATGGRLGGLLDGVVLQHLRVASINRGEPHASASLSAGAAILALAGLLDWDRFRYGRIVLSAFKGLSLLLAMGSVITLTHGGPYPYYAVALAWAAVPSPRDNLTCGPFPRMILAVVGALGTLQVFPVPGSHVAVSAVPLVIAAVVCGSDARSKIAGPLPRPAFLMVGRAALIAFVVVPQAFVLRDAYRLYSEGVSLGLRGMSLVRIAPRQASEIERTVEEIRGRCASLYTEPGQPSFHLWSGIRSPVGEILTAWWSYFDEDRQRRIALELRRAPGLCLLRNRKLIEFWYPGVRPRQTELKRLFDDARVVASHGPYEILRPSDEEPTAGGNLSSVPFAWQEDRVCDRSATGSEPGRTR